MRKFFAIVLSLAVLLSVLPCQALAAELLDENVGQVNTVCQGESQALSSISASETEKTAETRGTYDNLEYSIENGEVTITGYLYNPREITIPEMIDGYPVTEVGICAFKDCYSLECLEMPNVQRIDGSAFENCSSLSSVVMPKVQRIDGYAFEDCYSLESLEMPNVRAIDWCAFRNCNSLTSVQMLNVQMIGSNAFDCCENLTSFIISSDNAYYSANGGILYNKDKTILYAYPSATGDIKIANSVKTIYGCAFNDCYSLTGIEMPNVKTIGNEAFSCCFDLKSVKMPNVQSISSYAFYACASLISVEMPNVKEVAGNSFYGAAWYDNLTDEFAVFGDGVLVKYCGTSKDVTVPNNVKCVAGFYNANIINVDMPNVQAIGDEAFAFCDSLTSVKMPNVQNIGDLAFDQCGSLSSVEMPNVLTIGGSAFYICYSLTSAEMPNVQTIGGGAFAACSSLTSVYMPNVKEVAGSSFGATPWYNNLTDEFTVFGDGVLVKYCGTATEVIVPDNIKCIAGFDSNDNITSVKMPNVRTIGDDAFSDCDLLTSVEMPNVQTIGDGAFHSCESLTSVEMPNVQAIGDEAFYLCESLTSAYFYSDAPTSFGREVFDWCAPDFTIYYAKGTSGWTTPAWNGYPTKEFDPGNAALGDLNGDGTINAGDAVLVLRFAAELTNLNYEQQRAGDVNADGVVNVGDAVLILRYAAGLVDKF